MLMSEYNIIIESTVVTIKHISETLKTMSSLHLMYIYILKYIYSKYPMYKCNYSTKYQFILSDCTQNNFVNSQF